MIKDRVYGRKPQNLQTLKRELVSVALQNATHLSRKQIEYWTNNFNDDVEAFKEEQTIDEVVQRRHKTDNIDQLKRATS